MNMQGLFRDIQYFYYSVKSHQNLDVFKFHCTIEFVYVTGSPQVQKTLEGFLKITFTSLSCLKLKV